MLNNLETIKQTTKESINLLAQIQSEIDNILKPGLFDDSKTKEQHWKKIQQLLHSEENVLLQIDNVQSYFYSIIKELDKIKPTSKDVKQRQQAMDNFVESMSFKEYQFSDKDSLLKEHVFETKAGFIKSVINKIMVLIGAKDDNKYPQYNKREDNEVVEVNVPETIVKPIDVETVTETATKKTKV